jgi:uncharacterized membrane protein
MGDIMSKVLLIVGIILIVLALGFIGYGAVAAMAYSTNVDTLDDNKAARDALEAAGAPTSTMDSQIESDQELVDKQNLIRGICPTIGIIMIVLGVFLIFRYKKGKAAEATKGPAEAYKQPGMQPQQPQQPAYPPQQPGYPPQQPQQPAYPPQQPGYPPQQQPAYPPPQQPGYPPQQPQQPQYPQY